MVPIQKTHEHNQIEQLVIERSKMQGKDRKRNIKNMEKSSK